MATGLIRFKDIIKHPCYFMQLWKSRGGAAVYVKSSSTGYLWQLTVGLSRALTMFFRIIFIWVKNDTD